MHVVSRTQKNLVTRKFHVLNQKKKSVVVQINPIVKKTKDVMATAITLFADVHQPAPHQQLVFYQKLIL
ncbi:MAG: hypothetical protein C0512_14405 [Flavobacterium sp.]|nr:hypothetical protein [Flavobacterium sp.]